MAATLETKPKVTTGGTPHQRPFIQEMGLQTLSLIAGKGKKSDELLSKAAENPRLLTALGLAPIAFALLGLATVTVLPGGLLNPIPIPPAILH